MGGEETKDSCGGDGVVKEDKQKERSENYEDTNNNNNNNNNNEITVIKVDMHCQCQACAKKIVRALRASQGVEHVAVDRKTNMVEVKGKNTEPPLKLCDRIRHKTGRQAHLLSSLPKAPQEQPTDDSKIHHYQQFPHKPHQQPAAVRIVVLRVNMHCEACAQHLKKRIRKMKGVEEVETDVGKDEVTVKGEIADAEVLVEYVHKRTRKQVLLVKKEQIIKPEDSTSSEQEKIEPGKQEPAQEKDNDMSSSGAAAANTSIDEEDDKVMMMMGDMNRHAAYYDYWPSSRSYDYMDYYHTINNGQPPIFSDENPNACSII